VAQKHNIKQCLLTGSSGFVGQRLRARLQQLQLKTRLLQRKATALMSSEELQLWDFGATELPEGVLGGVDVLFHLAGVAHDVRNDKTEVDTYRTINVLATKKLAEQAVRENVRRIVFVSSTKAGGTPLAGRCATEIDQYEPEGIYGKTKREAELALLEIADKTDLQVSIVRPTLVYGPGLKGNLLLMLDAIARGHFPPLPPTDNRRSMIHIDDLVELLLLVAEIPEASGEIFIAADGQNYTSRQIYEIMCSGLGKKIPGWYMPKSLFIVLAHFGDQAGKLMNFPFDSYRLQKLLGDECYSAEKMHQKLGFSATRNLADSIGEIIAKYRCQQDEHVAR
jgi:nucleoside-diphosphate-sugar epimerase